MNAPPQPEPIPAATFTAEEAGYCELKFFSLQGRLGRLRYVAWLMGANMILRLVAQLGEPLALLTSLAGLAFSFTLMFRRLHDQEMSGWWLLIPMPFLFFIVKLTPV